jgi:hypothetical protein
MDIKTASSYHTHSIEGLHRAEGKRKLGGRMQIGEREEGSGRSQIAF